MNLRVQLDEAVSFVRTKSSLSPLVGIVLGSGLGDWADTLSETAVKKRGYFDPKKITALVENMNRTREFVFCKQVVSLVVLELWHQVFVDKAYKFDA